MRSPSTTSVKLEPVCLLLDARAAIRTTSTLLRIDMSLFYKGFPDTASRWTRFCREPCLLLPAHLASDLDVLAQPHPAPALRWQETAGSNARLHRCGCGIDTSHGICGCANATDI
jgi:hypothetical protein